LSSENSFSTTEKKLFKARSYIENLTSDFIPEIPDGETFEAHSLNLSPYSNKPVSHNIETPTDQQKLSVSPQLAVKAKKNRRRNRKPKPTVAIKEETQINSKKVSI